MSACRARACTENVSINMCFRDIICLWCQFSVCVSATEGTLFNFAGFHTANIIIPLITCKSMRTLCFVKERNHNYRWTSSCFCVRYVDFHDLTIFMAGLAYCVLVFFGAENTVLVISPRCGCPDIVRYASCFRWRTRCFHACKYFFYRLFQSCNSPMCQIHSTE